MSNAEKQAQEKAEWSVEDLNKKMFLVTAKADNQKNPNPQVLYQYTEMVLFAPDLRTACDIAEERFKDFDSVEVIKIQQVEEGNGKQREKDA